MAGRFSFSVPERRNASDPWFRIGTLDVNTTMLVVLASVASMFLWAFSQEAWSNLALIPDAVRSGEVWRLVTWPLANQPGLWPVLTVAIFWYFGREIEGLLGRSKFAVMLLLLAVIPGLAGVALDIADYSLAGVELAVFLVFIAEYPYARFFFGIPAWAIGAVIVGIQVLQYLGYRETERIFLLFLTIAVAALTARSMGLATNLPWIPKIPYPSRAGGSRGSRRRKRAGRATRGDVIDGPWGTTSRSGPARGSTLPQPPRPTDDPRDQIELDHLLDKISANGMDGLTSDEKRRLNELSKRLRNRR
jgi:membrane associated rhomboid family serine protease